MKNSTKLKLIISLIAASLFVFLLLITSVFDQIMFPDYHFKKRTHAELDRSIDDLIVMKITHSYPESHALHTALSEVFIPEIKQKAGLQFQVELYPDGSLGDEERQLLGVEHGSVEMAVIPGTEMKRFAAFSVFSIPYIFRDFSHLDAFLKDESSESVLAEELAFSGIRYMGWGFEGYRHIMKTRPSASYFSPNLTGVSSGESVASQRFFSMHGLIPQTYSTEALLGYGRDGSLPFIELSSSQFVNYSIQQVIRSIPFPRYLTVPSFFIADAVFWDALSPENKSLITSALEKTLTYEKELVLAEEAKFSGQAGSLFYGRSEMPDFTPSAAYYREAVRNIHEELSGLPDYIMQYK